MTLPLAFLNVEERHWHGDLGLPNQRRWLNHRNIGDEHRRTFPSAASDSNTARRWLSQIANLLSLAALNASRHKPGLTKNKGQRRSNRCLQTFLRKMSLT